MQSLKDFVKKMYVYKRLKTIANRTACFSIVDLKTQTEIHEHK
jgi:hypothetical protein